MGETKTEEKPEEKKVEEKSEEPEEKVEPSTGYDEEPKVDKKPEEKVEEKSEGDEEPKLEEQIDEILGDINDKETIKKFALDNNMTKEQVENYIALRKAEDQRLIEENAQRIKETRKGWFNELKNDEEFGGENFDRNIANVEKLLAKFLPNTKKQLTDTKGMLPPYIMRDLLKVHKALNPKAELVNGEPKQVEKETTNFLDDMYQ